MAEPSETQDSSARPPNNRRLGARHLEGLAILLLIWLVGEVAMELAGLPVPGSVAGMVLLLVGLSSGAVHLSWVESAADTILLYLGLLFVPPGVGLIVHLDLLRAQWLPITLSTVVGTLAVLAATAWAVELLAARSDGEGRKA